MAALPPDVPLGRGEAHKGRPDVVVLGGDEIPLRDPAAADLDELVHAPDAALVPRPFGRVHVLDRADRPLFDLRPATIAAVRVRKYRPAASPDRGHGQLRVLQPAHDRALPGPGRGSRLGEGR